MNTKTPQHTPGPWRWRRKQKDGYIPVAGPGGRYLTGTAELPIVWQQCCNAANAAMIAAAPELYAALETLERLSGSAMMHDDPARVAARAALLKANDRSQALRGFAEHHNEVVGAQP